MTEVTRRRFVAGAAGIGLGAFAAGRFGRASAQEATPADVVALGYVSIRVRQVASPEMVPEIDEIVIAEFVPQVQALPGYQGYLLGDVIENPSQNLSIVVFEDGSQVAAFGDAAESFVAGLDPTYAVETPTEVEGDLLIVAPPAPASATPVAATPVADGGYAAVRIYTSIPGTDPREFVPLVITGFLPIVQGIPGFRGYFYFPNEGGFTSISLFDNETSAQASTEAGREWATQNLAAYTDGNPTVITATVVYADLPILDALGAAAG